MQRRNSSLTRETRRQATLGRLVVVALSLTGCSGQPEPEGLQQPELVLSDRNLALSFDGVNDYGSVGTARFPLPKESMTVSLWVQPQSMDGRQSFATIRRDIQGGLDFGIEEGRLTAWSAGGGAPLVQDSTPLEPGIWQHVAYRYDWWEHCLFVQAVLVACGDDDDPDGRSPTSAWLGSYDGTRELYAGLLDDFRVWAVARNEASLSSEIAGDVLAADSDLRAYLSFDENWGSRAYDRSGNGNHMSLGDGVSDWMPQHVVVDGSKP